jgi:hypothetical protein
MNYNHLVNIPSKPVSINDPIRNKPVKLTTKSYIHRLKLAGWIELSHRRGSLQVYKYLSKDTLIGHIA